MTRRYTKPKLDSNTIGHGSTSGFVVDGYERLVSSIECEARRNVEDKYADEWNASGIWLRWQLQRKMDAEVADIVAKSMPDVSPDAFF
jgi:hypothetical protein